MALPVSTTYREVATSFGTLTMAWTVPNITPPVSSVTGSGTATFTIVGVPQQLCDLLNAMVADGRATVA